MVNMKRILLITLFLVLWSCTAWGATVYTKDISGTVYYNSSTSSCDGVTSSDTSGDLEAAMTAAGTNGTLYICAGTYTGTEIDSDSILSLVDGVTMEGIGTVIISNVVELSDDFGNAWNNDGDGNDWAYEGNNIWSFPNSCGTGEVHPLRVEIDGTEEPEGWLDTVDAVDGAADSITVNNMNLTTNLFAGSSIYNITDDTSTTVISNTATTLVLTDDTGYGVGDVFVIVDSKFMWGFYATNDTMYVYSEHGSGPTYDYSNMTGLLYNYTLLISDKDNWDISNIEFRGGRFGSIFIQHSQSGNIHDCTFGYMAYRAIRIYAAASANDENTDIEIYNNVLDTLYTTASPETISVEDGIAITDSCYQCKIYNNTFKNWGHAAIYIWANDDGGNYANDISECEIYNNDLSAPDIDYSRGLDLLGDDDSGDDSPFCYDNKIYRNHFHDFSTRIQFGGESNEFTNNIVRNIRNRSMRAGANDEAQGLYFAAYSGLGLCKDNIVTNNTFYYTDEPAIMVIAPILNVTGNTISNNIIMKSGNDSNYSPDLDNIGVYVPDDAQLQANTWKNNNVYDADTTDTIYWGAHNGGAQAQTVTEWNADTGDNCDGSCGAQTISSNISSNPFFLNAGGDSTDDYLLLGKSLAINAGAYDAYTSGVTVDYNGDPRTGLIDIGAIEDGSVINIAYRSGNDSNNGVSAAWKTLKDTDILPGTTLRFKERYVGNITMSRNGTSSLPIFLNFLGNRHRGDLTITGNYIYVLRRR